MEKEHYPFRDRIRDHIPVIGAVALAVASLLGIVIIICLVKLAFGGESY